MGPTLPTGDAAVRICVPIDNTVDASCPHYDHGLLVNAARKTTDDKFAVCVSFGRCGHVSILDEGLDALVFREK